MPKYPGDTVSLSVVITRYERRLDPSTLTVVVTAPGGGSYLFTYGLDAAVIKDNIGEYHLDFDVPNAPTSVGNWLVMWTAETDITQNIGDSFIISPQLNTVTITLNDASNNPVMGALVVVEDNTGAQYGLNDTNTSGQVTFRLSNGTYRVRAQKDGWYFAEWVVTVAGNTSTSLSGTYLGTEVPPTLTTCRIYGFIYDGSGVPVQAAVHIEVLGPASMAFAPQGALGVNRRNVGIVRGVRSIVSRAGTGYWEMDLVQGVRAKLSIPALRVEKEFLVPDQPVANYVDLQSELGPHVQADDVGNGIMRV